MAFCENGKKARELKGLTQAELAKRISVSQTAVANYERGTIVPTIIVGVELAEQLGTTVEKLVRGV